MTRRTPRPPCPRVRLRRRPAALLAVAVACAATAASAGAAPRLAWIVGAPTLARIAALDPVLAHRSFDTPATFVVATRRPSALPGAARALTTATFTDESALARALAAHRLPPGTRAVLYDDEHWPLTPVGQQTRPARFYRLAAEAAHRHGLLLVATPATDLVESLAPGTPSGQKYAAFLKLGVAAAAARYADVYEVQAQGAEMALAAYVAFVRAAAAQARAAHPGVEVLAGISTNAQGRVQSAGTLAAAVRATRSIVAGYWLNDPAGGAACPRCTGPYPQIAVQLLRDVERGATA